MPSLQHKLDRARTFLARLLAEHGPSRVAVAWTGGKDSTVALAVWRDVLAAAGQAGRPRVLNLDTGCKFPEILSFRDLWAARWGLDLTIARPDPAEVPPAPAVDVTACCRALKIDPLRRAVAEMGLAVLVTGVRADEHASRAAPEPLTQKTNPDYLQANPLLEWTEMDVWSYITAAGLPSCELYDRGYRSIGCAPCTSLASAGGERGGRNAQKESNMAALRAMGYF